MEFSPAVYNKIITIINKHGIFEDHHDFITHAIIDMIEHYDRRSASDKNE